MPMKSFVNEAVALLTEIEDSPEKKAWCKNFSVYALNMQRGELYRRIYDFMDLSYENGVVVSNYNEVISREKISESMLGEVDSAWLNEQSYDCVLACVTWHFRRDHFYEGSLINKSIADGTMLRLFVRLKILLGIES